LMERMSLQDISTGQYSCLAGEEWPRTSCWSTRTKRVADSPWSESAATGENTQ
jgi:hypothetical protein